MTSSKGSVFGEMVDNFAFLVGSGAVLTVEEGVDPMEDLASLPRFVASERSLLPLKKLERRVFVNSQNRWIEYGARV